MMKNMTRMYNWQLQQRPVHGVFTQDKNIPKIEDLEVGQTLTIEEGNEIYLFGTPTLTFCSFRATDNVVTIKKEDSDHYIVNTETASYIIYEADAHSY